jgi:hypothetical protein
MRLVGDCLKNDDIGDELIVMNDLLVFRQIVAPQDALAAKQKLLGEPVKCLDLVLRRAAGHGIYGWVRTSSRGIMRTTLTGRRDSGPCE